MYFNGGELLKMSRNPLILSYISYTGVYYNNYGMTRVCAYYSFIILNNCVDYSTIILNSFGHLLFSKNYASIIYQGLIQTLLSLLTIDVAESNELENKLQSVGKLGACLRVLLFVVCAFVSMNAGNMSSRKRVYRCMLACTKGEVLQGRSG